MLLPIPGLLGSPRSCTSVPATGKVWCDVNDQRQHARPLLRRLPLYGLFFPAREMTSRRGSIWAAFKASSISDLSQSNGLPRSCPRYCSSDLPVRLFNLQRHSLTIMGFRSGFGQLQIQHFQVPLVSMRNSSAYLWQDQRTPCDFPCAYKVWSLM